MPYLVYWFDTSLQQGTPHVTLEESGAIMSYEFGERLNYDQVPKEITKKLMAHGEAQLSAEERVICQALVALDNARVSGAPPMAVQVSSFLVAAACDRYIALPLIHSYSFVFMLLPQPDDALYKVVRASELSLPTPNTLQKKTETAADALIEMMGPQEQQQQSQSKSQPQKESKSQSNKPMPTVGDRVKVYWEYLETYFYGFVDTVRGDFYFIIYDDEEVSFVAIRR